MQPVRLNFKEPPSSSCCKMQAVQWICRTVLHELAQGTWLLQIHCYSTSLAQNGSGEWAIMATVRLLCHFICQIYSPCSSHPISCIRVDLTRLARQSLFTPLQEMAPALCSSPRRSTPSTFLYKKCRSTASYNIGTSQPPRHSRPTDRRYCSEWVSTFWRP